MSRRLQEESRVGRLPDGKVWLMGVLDIIGGGRAVTVLAALQEQSFVFFVAMCTGSRYRRRR